MKSKVMKVFTIAAFAAGMVGAAAPAQAGTCEAYDPVIDYVVCDTIYNPVVGTACRVVEKVFPSCLA